MQGKVSDGDLVTVVPCDAESLRVGDIVLVRVHGRDYLHLLKARDGARFQIGNNRGGINGWVGRNALYGKAIKVEPGDTKPLSKEALSQEASAVRKGNVPGNTTGIDRTSAE